MSVGANGVSLVIASTCNHWRNIALSHPILLSKDGRLLDLYLERSRPVLLSLSVTAVRGVDDEDARFFMLDCSYYYPDGTEGP